ncbi:MAG: ketoacyl-ACP synthase III [Deltaproteobacteria bacterium]|nr:ketoacyl-ACP synthase III [Deltaproteobacteria bacterium]
MGARIIGTGSAVPSTCLTNADMERRVATSHDWIVTRTGIHKRRAMKQGEDILDLMHAASTQALEAAGLGAQDLQAIVVATVSGDYFFPSTACLLQARLGVDTIPAFDVGAACAGFVYGMSVVHSYVKSGEYGRLLLVGADTLSTMVNWQDRSTCVLFGDGAGAVVLDNQPGERGLLSTVIESSGALWELLYVRSGPRQTFDQEGIQPKEWGIQMKGPELFKVAVRALSDVACKALERAGLSPTDVHLMIPHQANLRIIQAVADRMGVGMEKVHCNIQRFGNTSAASIPIALDEAVRAGKIHDNDIVVLNACGGGLTWGASVVRW